MTTTAEWIDITKDLLLNGVREEMDILAADITAAATTLGVTDGANGIQSGAEIEVDLERMYVRSVAAAVVTVRRGYRGSTPAAHTANADVIVLPKFPKARILRELNNELAALSSPTNGLFKIPPPLEFTWRGATYGYDLTGVADVEDVLSVQWENYVGNDWIPVPPTQWRLGRSQQTADFPSGLALFFDAPVPGRVVRVVYRAPFTTLSTLTDNVETVTGLPATAVDIPPLGAAISLAAPGEIRRTFIDVQGDPRADEDVPVGSRTNSVRWLIAQRQRRIQEESARLSRDFPKTLAR